MKKILACLLLTTALPVNAVICKSVDSKGNVAYADVPASECQNRVKLPPVSSYKPRALPTSSTGSPVGASVTAAYSSMKISQPANAATVRSNEGEVLISVELKPGLKKGDKLKLMVDGQEVNPLFDGLSVALSGVQRGTHRLSAQIVDASGEVKFSADPVSFTLRKASLLDPFRTKDTEGASVDKDASTSSNSDSSTVTNKAGSSSHTPGATNPNFAPKYRP